MMFLTTPASHYLLLTTILFLKSVYLVALWIRIHESSIFTFEWTCLFLLILKNKFNVLCKYLPLFPPSQIDLAHFRLFFTLNPVFSRVASRRSSLGSSFWVRLPLRLCFPGYSTWAWKILVDLINIIIFSLSSHKIRSINWMVCVCLHLEAALSLQRACLFPLSPLGVSLVH